uniref:Uncharacterized protein n=1 Tax=Knipowitschia caucasica TaxID=637954 RepID=A0AAV2JS21_KNICA
MLLPSPHSIKSFFMGALMDGAARRKGGAEEEGRCGGGGEVQRCRGPTPKARFQLEVDSGRAATLADDPPEAVGLEMNAPWPEVRPESDTSLVK